MDRTVKIITDTKVIDKKYMRKTKIFMKFTALIYGVASLISIVNKVI